jgi:hypothetical protein
MGTMINPFPHDPDCSAIWTMLVERDIDAFLARDWVMVEDDFIAEGFFGLHARFKPRPDDWIMAFPELARYRDEWLRQANETANVAYAEPLRPAIFRATDLSVIDIVGERAVARKKFNGVIARVDGGSENLDWQTLYFCAKRDDAWKITSLVGYLPRLLGEDNLSTVYMDHVRLTPKRGA